MLFVYITFRYEGIYFFKAEKNFFFREECVNYYVVFLISFKSYT